MSMWKQWRHCQCTFARMSLCAWVCACVCMHTYVYACTCMCMCVCALRWCIGCTCHACACMYANSHVAVHISMYARDLWLKQGISIMYVEYSRSVVYARMFTVTNTSIRAGYIAFTFHHMQSKMCHTCVSLWQMESINLLIHVRAQSKVNNEYVDTYNQTYYLRSSW